MMASADYQLTVYSISEVRGGVYSFLPDDILQVYLSMFPSSIDKYLPWYSNYADGSGTQKQIARVIARQLSRPI